VFFKGGLLLVCVAGSRHTVSRSGRAVGWSRARQDNVASKEGAVSFLILMVNTLALQHLCLQRAFAEINDTFSCKQFLEVQRKGGGHVKDHLIGLVNY